jgi:hypothetical protein
MSGQGIFWDEPVPLRPVKDKYPPVHLIAEPGAARTLCGKRDGRHRCPAMPYVWRRFATGRICPECAEADHGD